MSLVNVIGSLGNDGYMMFGPGTARDALGQLRSFADEALADAGSRQGGVRFPLSNVEGMADAVRQTRIPELLWSVFREDGSVVRSILFDKTPESNWAVPWHRDETIAVRERHDIEGFGPWSEKDGVPHVRPPNAILDKMVTIRLHLDDCDEASGALRIRPGSHRDAWDGNEVVCALPAGSALLMRPRLEHASSKAAAPSRRRVLHLECACEELPTPLEWAERIECPDPMVQRFGPHF